MHERYRSVLNPRSRGLSRPLITALGAALGLTLGFAALAVAAPPRSPVARSMGRCAG